MPRPRNATTSVPAFTPASAPQRNDELAAAIARLGRPKYILAAEARLPGSAISEIVAGRLVPSPEQASRLAAVLGVSVEIVTGGAA